MSGFKLDPSYVDVAERISIFREKYPEGSLQSELVPCQQGFLAMRAYAYRTPDDPRPGIGHAWEPVPGKTPYTKDSEMMNAETSAWGRAIIAALAADTKKGIASADEIASRQDAVAYEKPTEKIPPATALQVERIRTLLAELPEFSEQKVCNGWGVTALEALDASQATATINRLEGAKTEVAV